MIFLLALIATYQLTDLKQIVVLVTAFTLGHSLTLALATTGILVVESALVEFLIPITILITAVANLIRGKRPTRMWLPYISAAFFGLIHGAGFSNYLRALLGSEGELTIPLLAFNLGLETGQIAIVLAILLLSALAFSVFRFKHRDYILVVSGAAAGIALVLIKNAWYF